MIKNQGGIYYDGDEEEDVIAKVDYKTKEIEYLDEDARIDYYAQEIINKTIKEINNGNFKNCT